MMEIKDKITPEKMNKYFAVGQAALQKAWTAPRSETRKEEARQVLDMAQRYFDDALFFRGSGDYALAFAALNYAHGWLDCAATLGLIKVKDNHLFTVDGE